MGRHFKIMYKINLQDLWLSVNKMSACQNNEFFATTNILEVSNKPTMSGFTVFKII